MIAECGPFVIRDFEPWEGPRLFVMTGDPNTTRYLGFRTHTSVNQAAELIQRYRFNTEGRYLAVCSKDDTADVLGVVGLEIRGHQATIFLMFRKGTRGAGRLFSRPFIAWVFSHPQIWRLWSYVHVDNIMGQRVTERLGAQKEGRLRRFEYFPNVSDEPQDVFVYSIVR